MATNPLRSLGFGSEPYTVPVPVNKTSDMTQEVGVDSDGKLYTKPGTADAVAKNQGTAKAGQFLVVGSDGNVTTRTMDAWQGGSY